MAESFALPEQRPVFSQETAAAQAPQTGLVGGNISGGLQLRDPSKDAPSALDNLFKFAMKIGDEKLAEYESAEKDRKFMEGMGRAAAGEAAKDISSEQPWWARMFSDSNANVVAGARAWEGATDANHMEASVMERMKELRTLPPSKAQAAMLEIHKTMQSGDPVRDATQNAMWIKALPGILKHHAKEHLAYQHEVATEAQRKGIESGFDAVEARVKAGNGFMSDSDADGVLESLAQTMTVPKGVNPKTHAAQVVEGLANTIAAGKFQPFIMARKHGMLENVPKEQRRALDVLYDRTAQEKMAETVPPGIIDRIGLLAGVETPEALRAAVKSINDDAKAATGIDYPLISTNEEHGYTTRVIQQSIAERERELKSAKDAATRARASEALATAKKAAKDQLAREQTAMAEKLAVTMVRDPNPASIPTMTALNADLVTVQKLKRALPVAVAEAWVQPILSDEDKASIAALPPEKAAVAGRALEAQARWNLLNKPGADLSIVKIGIGEALKTGDYTQAQVTIEALAMGAVGAGKDKLPDRFSKLVPKEHQPMVAAFANIYNNLPLDPKTGDRDGAAAWAAAELQMATSVKKPLKAADRKAIDAEIAKSSKRVDLSFDSTAADVWKRFAGDATSEAQPRMLLSLLAAREFDSRVSSGIVTPASVAVAAAKERTVILEEAEIAYVANPQAESNVWDTLPEGEKFLLNKPFALGHALRDALTAKGGMPETSVIYRADDSPKGEPSFIATAPSGGFLVLTLTDLKAAAKKRSKLPDAAPIDTTPLGVAP
jgi:hypothetical protein